MDNPKSNLSKEDMDISNKLRNLANEFLNNKLKSNNLIDIIELVKGFINKREPASSGILTIEVVFKEILKRREMLQTEASVPEAMKRYRMWLQQRYRESITLLENAICHDNIEDCRQAVKSCMNLIEFEFRYPINPKKSKKFPTARLQRILQKLLSNQREQAIVIQEFKNYTKYIDVVGNCWQILSNNLMKRASLKEEVYASNILEFISVISVTKKLQKDNEYYCPLDNMEGIESKGSQGSSDYNTIRTLINKIWKELIESVDFNKSKSLHQKLLIALLESILEHLQNPILLTDFLMNSLDCGGAVSLLALQGVFTLVYKHNIEYPNIYNKLYAMFHSEIFNTKYKARLFYLADIFLTSTHLPESIVAAFIKRLARLSLMAPPQDILIILRFIGNLIIRHPSLKHLINAEQALEAKQDPFIMEETEPTKSNALESSLWEVQLLQHHAVPSVVTAAKFVNQPLPKQEWDLSSLLELDEDKIFSEFINRDYKEYALTHQRPTSLHSAKDDKFEKFWNLT